MVLCRGLVMAEDSPHVVTIELFNVALVVFAGVSVSTVTQPKSRQVISGY